MARKRQAPIGGAIGGSMGGCFGMVYPIILLIFMLRPPLRRHSGLQHTATHAPDVMAAEPRARRAFRWTNAASVQLAMTMRISGDVYRHETFPRIRLQGKMAGTTGSARRLARQRHRKKKRINFVQPPARSMY